VKATRLKNSSIQKPFVDTQAAALFNGQKSPIFPSLIHGFLLQKSEALLHLTIDKNEN
jgi:hypothetical protein